MVQGVSSHVTDRGRPEQRAAATRRLRPSTYEAYGRGDPRTLEQTDRRTDRQTDCPSIKQKTKPDATQHSHTS